MRAYNATERYQWADLCRALSIYGVVLLHSCGACFYQYGKIPLGDWLSANFLDSSVRCTIPLFVMLSGALILRRGIGEGESPFFSKIIRRIIKVLLPLLVWSGIYLMFVSYHSGKPINWLSILSEPAMYHLWFVYMIIGLYLFIPLFQIIFEAILTRPILLSYMFVLWFVVTCIPVYWPIPLLSIIQQKSFFGYGGYFLIGAIIATANPNRLPTFWWAILFLLSMLTTFGVTWYLSWQAKIPVETAYLYFSPNVLVSAVSAFVLLTRARLPPLVVGLMQWISDRSFCIYFIHVLALESVRYSNFIFYINQHSPMIITILVISMATFALSLLASSLIKLVPGAYRVFG